MKKALLLLLSLGLLGGLSSCGSDDKKKEPEIPIDDPVDPSIHATSITVDPNQPFYLKVNETKTLKATLSPSPTNDDEKTFTWSTTGDIEAVQFVSPSTSNTIDIIGKKVGSTTVRVVNDYNRNLYKTFEVKVIDYDSDKTYLWEYDSEDRKQFGYDSKTQPDGIKSGTAILGGMEWNFERSEVIAIQSLNGGVGFGKGKAPETHVHLESENQRPIKNILIETGSAEGLTNVTVKVGDQEVINAKAPDFVDRHCGSLEASNLSDLTGNITIDFETPKYDPDRKDDPTYKAPGAAVLKSIWITYGEESFDFVTEKTYDFKAMYDDPEGVFKGLTQSVKELTLEDDDFVIKFAKIANTKGKDDPLVGYAKSNGDIEVLAKKTGEVIKQVQFTYQCASTAVDYDIYSSIVGQAPYDKIVAIGNNEGVSGTIYRDHVNAVNLSISRSNYVALKSLTIKTVAGTHAEIDSVSFAEGAKPDQVEYNYGDTFNPEGLGNATIKFKDSGIEEVEVGTELFAFYDGPSYEDPADHSGKSLTFKEGTTYVIGVYQGFEVKIEGLTVVTEYVTLNRVSNIDDLTSGEYLFVIPSVSKYWKGSMANADMKEGKSVADLGGITIGNTIDVPESLLSETLSITNTNGILIIRNKNSGRLGMTKSGAFAIAATPSFFEWSATVTDSLVDFVIEGDSYTKYLAFGGTKFDLKDSSTANIALYKVSE